MSEQKQPAEVGPVELVLGPLPEPAGFRTRYRSEPGMIGHYPWTYADQRRRKYDRPECEYEDLFTAEQLRAAVAAERERPRQVVAYMATNREGEVRFTDNPSAARELEGYGWAITPLADAGPNVRANPAP